MADQRLKNVSALVQELHAKYPDYGFEIHPSLEFASHNGTGVFARAKKAVLVDEILLVIPEAERITFNNVADNNIELGDKKVSLAKFVKTIGKKVGNTIEEVEPKDITLPVLIMYMLANETRFEATIATWPSKEELNGQFSFRETEKDAMKGTYAEYLITLNERVLEKVFADIIFPAIDKAQLSHYFAKKEGGAVTRNDLWEVFQYAFCLANSRCHDGKANGVSADIIPLVDLLNGLPEKSKDVNVAIARGKWPFLRGSIFKDDFNFSCSAVYATRDLEPGEELFISYGDLTPCAFVFKYGCCPEQFLREHLTVDMVSLWCPLQLAPAENDTKRLKALKACGYPVTAREIEEQLVVYLNPHELEEYRWGINGIGGDRRGYQEREPEQLKVVRQFIILAVLADRATVEHHLKTQRLRGNFSFEEIGRVMLQVVDYNLDNLETEATSVEEYQRLNNGGVSEGEKAAIMSRICYREALAQWRHVICRRYSIFSAADDSKPIREVLSMVYASFTTPSCLQGGGCSVCGRTIGTQKCARCKQISYCSRGHQRLHWKLHKPICVPVNSGNVK